MTELAIIVAVSDNNIIGNGNALPWRIPEDLRRFKALTLGHTLIMGRRTFDSIGRPLPGRTTVVLTRRPDFHAPGVLVARDRDEAVALAQGPQAFVAGGADTYRLFFPIVTKLFITRVHGTYEGDTRFPAFDREAWTVVSSENTAGSTETPACTFEVLVRAT